MHQILNQIEDQWDFEAQDIVFAIDAMIYFKQSEPLLLVFDCNPLVYFLVELWMSSRPSSLFFAVKEREESFPWRVRISVMLYLCLWNWILMDATSFQRRSFSLSDMECINSFIHTMRRFGVND